MFMQIFLEFIIEILYDYVRLSSTICKKGLAKIPCQGMYYNTKNKDDKRINVNKKMKISNFFLLLFT